MPKKKKIVIIEFPCECPHRHTFNYKRFTPDLKPVEKGTYCHHNFVNDMKCENPDKFPRKCPLDDFRKNMEYCWD